MYLLKVITSLLIYASTISHIHCMFVLGGRSSSVPTCPPSHLFEPCECYLHAEHMRIIRCGGQHSYDLSAVFSRLSSHLSTDDKHFHMFYLNNTAIDRLDNVFRDITFDYIYFDGASSLESIDSQAFQTTGRSVKEVRAFNTKLKQSSLEEALVGVSSLLHLTVSNVAQCPPEHMIKPCRCQYKEQEWQWVQAKFTRIICGQKMEEDIDSVYLQSLNRTEEQIGYYTMRRLQLFFERLSDNLNKMNWQKRFDEFVLQNSPISEIPRNVFNDIIFYGIIIDNCPRLTAIHPLAFTMTAPFVEELLIRRTKLSNDRFKQKDIFNAITSLTNLRALYLHWSGLMSIPHHAFRPLKGQFQRKLVKVSVKYTKSDRTALRMVGSYAFYYLPNLKTIDLSLNSIVKVYRNAFSLRWPSNEVLEINLAGNNLTDNSIEPSAFLEVQRPVHVILGQGAIGNPHLYHLDEGVYRLFFKENSKNRVSLYSSKNTRGLNRLMCDCKSRWMFDEVGRVRQGLVDVMCYSNANTNWECLPPCLVFGHDLIHCGSNKWFDFKEELSALSQRLLPHERHFKRMVLSNTEIEELPDRAFAEITFEHLELDGCVKLKHISDKAFVNTADHLQRIVVRNTGSLSSRRSNQLKWSQFPNLTHIDLSFDDEFRLFNTSFESEVVSNKTLYIRLNRDKIKSDTIEENAFNGANRPIQLFFDSYKDVFDPMGCQLMNLAEKIYAPFLASHPSNQIHVMWCPIVCDCSVRWLYDAPMDWWLRVDAGDPSVGLQCPDHRALYTYAESEFRGCPKTNLLKYLVRSSPNSTITSTTSPKTTSSMALSTLSSTITTILTASTLLPTTTTVSSTTPSTTTITTSSSNTLSIETKTVTDNETTLSSMATTLSKEQNSGIPEVTTRVSQQTTRLPEQTTDETTSAASAATTTPSSVITEAITERSDTTSTSLKTTTIIAKEVPTIATILTTSPPELTTKPEEHPTTTTIITASKENTRSEEITILSITTTTTEVPVKIEDLTTTSSAQVEAISETSTETKQESKETTTSEMTSTEETKNSNVITTSLTQEEGAKQTTKETIFGTTVVSEAKNMTNEEVITQTTADKPEEVVTEQMTKIWTEITTEFAVTSTESARTTIDSINSNSSTGESPGNPTTRITETTSPLFSEKFKKVAMQLTTPIPTEKYSETSSYAVIETLVHITTKANEVTTNDKTSTVSTNEEETTSPLISSILSVKEIESKNSDDQGKNTMLLIKDLPSSTTISILSDITTENVQDEDRKVNKEVNGIVDYQDKTTEQNVQELSSSIDSLSSTKYFFDSKPQNDQVGDGNSNKAKIEIDQDAKIEQNEVLISSLPDTTIETTSRKYLDDNPSKSDNLTTEGKQEYLDDSNQTIVNRQDDLTSPISIRDDHGGNSVSSDTTPTFFREKLNEQADPKENELDARLELVTSFESGQELSATRASDIF